MNKLQNFLQTIFNTKQKKVSGDVDITKMIDELKKKRSSMNDDLINQATEILREAENKFGAVIFAPVKAVIEQQISSGSTVLVDMIAKKQKRGWFIRECIYTMIANTSGDMVGHLSDSANRDELKEPMIDLLKIFDAAIDELVLLDDIDIEEARKLKTDIRKKTNVWPK